MDEPLHMQFVRAGTAAVGQLVTKAVPVPVVDTWAGWAVQVSLDCLLERGEAIRKFRHECNELKKILDPDSAAWNTLCMLDVVADVGTPNHHEPPLIPPELKLYEDTCAVLAEINFLVARAEAKKAEGLMPRLLHAISSTGSQAQAARDKLKTAVAGLSDENLRQKLAKRKSEAIESAASAGERRLGSFDEQVLRPLQTRTDTPPGNHAELVLPPPHQHHPMVQHGDYLWPYIRTLLCNSRNTVISGMGGIGKTTIASAVFQAEQVSGRFHRCVWLEVGQKPRILDLLKSAFDQLFTDRQSSPYGYFWYDFDEASTGLQRIARRVRDHGWGVLLVLDDVWPSLDPAAVAELNFATHPSFCMAESRLIVTTRQRSNVHYTPHEIPIGLPADANFVMVPPLGAEFAQQLFHQHAFDIVPHDLLADDRVHPELQSRLISSCEGHPGLLCSLAGSVKSEGCSVDESPQIWQDELMRWESEMVSGKDSASKECERSVKALPASVLKCFCALAAFRPDAWVPEADVLNLFATQAPLHMAASVSAAAHKLQQLVQHNLVSATWQDGRWLFSMHPILHRIAKRRASALMAGSTACRFSGGADAARNPAVQCLGIHKPHGEGICLTEALTGYLDSDHKLHVCVVSGMGPQRQPPPRQWPLRLRFLHLDEEWAGGWRRPPRLAPSRPVMSINSGVGCPVVLHSLNLSRSNVIDALQCFLPAIQLLHLDLSYSVSMVKLPSCILSSKRSSTNLVHLNLRGCSQLTELPDSLGKCKELMILDLGECLSLKELPSNIQQCTALMHLHMTGCSHEGLSELPAGIGSSTKLAHLDLGGCSGLKRLVADLGVIHAGMELTHLDLSECPLQSLPSSIGNYRHLSHLCLTRCSELQALPESTGHLTQLVSLDLSRCSQLRGLPDRLNLCRSLTRLDLSGCTALTEATLPQTLSGCGRLQHLSLGQNPWLQTVPEIAQRLVALTTLDLTGCEQLQVLPPFDAMNLRCLILRSCVRLDRFAARPDATYSHLQQLMHLDISGCLHLVLAPWLGVCGCLTHLDLTGYSNPDMGEAPLPNTITNCNELVHLCLSGCSGMVRLPDTIGGDENVWGCRHLTHLDLTGCARLSSLPQSISNCNELAHLCLQGCSGLAELPPDISSCTQLTHMDLSGCTSLQDPPRILHGPEGGQQLCPVSVRLILAGWSNVPALPDRVQESLGPRLTRLDLSGCSQLTALPGQVCSCSHMADLCLRDCAALETLPVGVRGWVHLARLDIRGCTNLLQLPAQLRDCRQLKRIEAEEGLPAVGHLQANRDEPGYSRLLSLLHMGAGL